MINEQQTSEQWNASTRNAASREPNTRSNSNQGGDGGRGEQQRVTANDSGRSACRYYVFTINNYSSVEEEALSNAVGIPGGPTYVIYGREIGSCGTPHLQGYVEFPKRIRLSSIKAVPGFERAHLERRRGKQHEAISYCKKDGDFVEFGTAVVSKQGRRADLERVADAIREGVTVGDLWRDFTTSMIRYSKGIIQARAYLCPPSSDEFPKYDLTSFSFSLIMDMKKSHVIWGPAGCGKTCYVRSRFPDALWVTHMDDLLGYDDQKVIVFDDMCFTHMPRTAQIHLVDTEQPRSIHCRYHAARIPAGVTRIFTSNVKEVFVDDPAIRRRVKYHEIVTFRSLMNQ